MKEVLLALSTVSLLLGFVIVGVLLVFRKDHNYPVHFLILSLTGLMLPCLTTFLVNSGWLVMIPWYFRFPNPIILLIAPASFLYVRTTLRGEIRFNRKYLLLALPALVHFIEMVPFYLMPLAEKEALVKSYIADRSRFTKFNEGLLPPYVMPILRSIWNFTLILLQWMTIRNFEQKQPNAVLTNNRTILIWLRLFTQIMLLLAFLLLIISLLQPVLFNSLYVLNIVLCLLVSALCISLILKPEVLYGVFKPSTGIYVESIHEVPPTPSVFLPPSSDQIDRLSEAAYSYYRNRIETFLKEKHPYLNPEYSLQSLSADLDIPKYTVSAVINREFGFGFREFINRYRIQFILDNLLNPDWKNYTFEAMARESGFKNRSTFVRNFKLVTGRTLSDYLREQG